MPAIIHFCPILLLMAFLSSWNSLTHVFRVSISNCLASTSPCVSYSVGTGFMGPPKSPAGLNKEKEVCDGRSKLAKKKRVKTTIVQARHTTNEQLTVMGPLRDENKGEGGG